MIRKPFQDEASTIPPRPNPGPEPWPRTDYPSPWWLLLGLPVMAVAVWKLRRSPAKKPPGTTPTSLEELSPLLSPPERLVHLAEKLREGLVRAFGTTMAAYTTEELDLALPSQRIALPRPEIIQLFRAADRVKFGDQAVDGDYLVEAESLATSVIRDLAAGDNSNQNGR